MNFLEKYHHIISELSKGHRGLVHLSPEELGSLNQLLETPPEGDLEKILCIIQHSSRPYLKFETNLLSLLQSKQNKELLVIALNCSRKHIIEARFQRGQRLEYEFLETLKGLLYHPEIEVVEWALRIIEGCGNQGVYFLREFDKIKPPPWKWFNANQRAVRELIALLEARWRSFEKT